MHSSETKPAIKFYDHKLFEITFDNYFQFIQFLKSKHIYSKLLLETYIIE